MKSGRFHAIGVAAALLAAPAAALPMDWTLIDEFGDARGALRLDFVAGVMEAIDIQGDLDRYTSPSRAEFGVGGFLAGRAVLDVFQAFSPASGMIFRTDYADGGYYELLVNEAALRIGSVGAPLSPAGGVFPVVVEEVYNYDEVEVTCNFLEEIYDPGTGDFIGFGPCGSFSTVAYFNVEDAFAYDGLLRFAAAPGADVPVPAAAGMLAAALAGLWGASRRRRSPLG